MQESTIDLPDHIRDNQVIGAGLSFWVHRLDAVVKSFPSDGASERATEVSAYKRLAVEQTWPRGVLRFYGILDDLSIVLEHAPNGSIRSYLGRHPCVALSTKLRWADQAASAIAFLHSKDIFHCDISCNNIFLDKDLNALVCDFAGSSIDGKEWSSWYETSHCPPDLRDPSKKTEIFALGSTLFEMLLQRRPFEGVEEHEIEDALRVGRFPSLDPLPALGVPIAKCWAQQYESVDELLEDIKAECIKAEGTEREGKSQCLTMNQVYS